MEPSPPRLLLLLLLAASCIDYGLCQQSLNIIQDSSTCLMSPAEWNRTVGVGTTISATCERTCTEDAVERNQNTRERTVRGTGVYSLDSDLCLAAIHDARLAYPSNWESDTSRVDLTVVQHQGRFVPSFRRGITTPAPRKTNNKARLGVVFISGKADESIPEITAVYNKFRYQDKNPRQTVECHAPIGLNLSEYKAFRPTGVEYQSWRTTLYENDTRGNFKEIRVGTGGTAVCSKRHTLYSDTTAFGYIENPYIAPTRLVYRVSRGDRIEVEMQTDSYLDTLTWYKDGSVTDIFDRLDKKIFVRKTAEMSDSGLYRLQQEDGATEGNSALSVIVRSCPAGHYGAGCRLRCPHCLHGGQCHDVTGECVCPSGFFGDRCQTSCEKGRFGATCSSKCSGPDGDCKDQLLCVPEPLGCGCASGYKGTFCNTPCSRGNYGPDCVSSCGRCKDKAACDSFTGKCENGCEAGFFPPLCLDLAPWFRDPPAVVRVGYTTLTVTHRPWRQDYDNGYGSGGTYNYTLEYRSGRAADWSRGQTQRRVTAGNVTFSVHGLDAETTYVVRIVIGDERRGTSTTDDKVPTVNATTDCQGPIFNAVNVTKTNRKSAVLVVQPLRNEKEACAYSLHWTLSTAPSGKMNKVYPGEDGRTEIRLRDLLPFTEYVVQVFARNRKGKSEDFSRRFQTKEAPPTRVENLTVKKKTETGLKYTINWEKPRRPNGRIRRYIVVLKHGRYLACDDLISEGKESSLNVTKTIVEEMTVEHPFSEYSVTVTAVTIAPGPASTTNFNSERQAPSAGLASPTAGDVRAAQVRLSWSLPACTTWNDNFTNARINLEVRGTSRWNMNKLYEQARSRTKTSILFLGLTPYSNYTAFLKFNNSVGFSTDHQRISFTTEQSGDGPGRPSNLTQLTVSSTSLTVGWSPPSPPLCRVTEYRVRCQGPGCTGRRLAIPEGGHCRGDGALPCQAVVDDLKEVTIYQIMVSAYCSDVRREGQESVVEGKTQEGKPGPPEEVGQEGWELMQIRVVWTSPRQRNGVILQYQLNVTEAEASEPLQPHVIETTQEDTAEQRQHSFLVTGLAPGRSYLVSVAASTSAGQGSATTALLETQVPPPQPPAPPRVRPDLVTDSTVTLTLPSATRPDGPPISRYYVIVSEDPDFNGRQVEGYSSADLPNAEEASSRGISFYVAAVADPEHVDQNGTVVIGDGTQYNTSDKSYYNQPLKTGGTYRMGMAVLTKLSDNNQALGFIDIEGVVTVGKQKAIGMILGILFSVIVVALLIIGVVVCRRRHMVALQHSVKDSNKTSITADRLSLQPMYSDPEQERQNAEQNSDETYANLSSLFLNKTRIPVPDLPAAARDVEQLRSQIGSLQSGLIRPCKYARLVQNRAKNRYGNLMPYDDSRVKLTKLDDDEFSDYINASFVDGYERPRAYIATQGPKPETIFDFWRMLWENKAVRIVMLTNLVEGDKKKCDLYWPEDKPLQLLGLTVLKESERVSNDYTIRTFSMTRDGERRTVTHLHYTVWPDHSVPLYPSSLARFVRELDAVPDGGGPTVVHCSAGVGRTGTVILIDAMYKMGRHEQAVDVYRQLTIIREQRANLCANQAQYQLVHQVLVELLVSPSTAIPAAQLANRLPQLKSVADGPSGLEQQLSYLASNPPPASFTSARGEQLEGKNRSPEILPEDKSRVFLHGNMRDNYINAVYVQGFKKPDAFIATEAPLPARRSIFWQMIIQKQSQTIVVMKDLAPEDVFWPITEEPVIYGSIAAQLKNRISEPVETLDITLNVFTNGQMESSQEVRLFLLPFGPTPSTLPSPGDIVSLHAAYERSMPHNFGGVTTVVCRTGVTGCGLFIACSFVMDQLAEEQEVDVAMAVSTVRKSRPQFIGTLKQYELCYDVALAWLKAFDIYSNFQ